MHFCITQIKANERWSIGNDILSVSLLHIAFEWIEILERQSQSAANNLGIYLPWRDPYNFLLPRVHLILLFNSLHPFRFCYLGAALVLRERNFFAAFKCIATLCVPHDEMRTTIKKKWNILRRWSLLVFETRALKHDRALDQRMRLLAWKMHSVNIQ